MFEDKPSRLKPAQIAAAKSYVEKQTSQLRFNTEHLDPDLRYVAWLDLMGAGHLMSTSMPKIANFIARLHMAVDIACKQLEPHTIKRFAINDGVFISTPRKDEITKCLRRTLTTLACQMLSELPQHRSLVRAGISYGPVVDGEHLAKQIRKDERREKYESAMSNMLFGPPTIQAYQSERHAPAFGVAVHESARAFSSPGNKPFRSTHWLWWLSDEFESARSPVADIATLVGERLLEHCRYLRNSALFQELSVEKISQIEVFVRSYYFADGSAEQDNQ